jgi:hypothetical protein
VGIQAVLREERKKVLRGIAGAAGVSTDIYSRYFNVQPAIEKCVGCMVNIL